MGILGPLILTSLIMAGAGAYAQHVARNAVPLLPPPARDRVRQVAASLPAQVRTAAAKAAAVRAPARGARSGKRGMARLVFAGPSPLPQRVPARPAGGQPASARPALRAVPPPAGRAPAVPVRQSRPVKPAEVSPVPANTTASATGAGADLFSAVSTIAASARAGGIRSKVRALLMLAEGLEMMAMTLTQLGRDLAEPGMRYPSAVWEPVTQGGSHVKAAGLACAEAHSTLMAMLHRALGEQLGQVPHHQELNSGE